jgi:hypothetical protein
MWHFDRRETSDRDMSHRFFNIASALSPLVCVGVLTGCAEQFPESSNFRRVQILRGVRVVTVQEQQALAARSRLVYVSNGTRWTLGYLDGNSLYPFAWMSLKKLPFGPYWSLPVVDVAAPPGTVQEIGVPTYIVVHESGSASLGYFEPKSGPFLRWPNADLNAATVRMLPRDDHEPFELGAERIKKTVEIDVAAHVTSPM